MSQAFDHVVQQLGELSDQEKASLRILLDQKESVGDNGTAHGNVSAFGWAKGQITISADFDEPLEDFKDYVD